MAINTHKQSREVKIRLNRVKYPRHCNVFWPFPEIAPQSDGSYLYSRTNRYHPGVDVLCSDGSVVYAPFTGMIVGQEKPYRNKNAINNGLRLSGRGKSTDLGHSLVRC